MHSQSACIPAGAHQASRSRAGLEASRLHRPVHTVCGLLPGRQHQASKQASSKQAASKQQASSKQASKQAFLVFLCCVSTVRKIKPLVRFGLLWKACTSQLADTCFIQASALCMCGQHTHIYTRSHTANAASQPPAGQDIQAPNSPRIAATGLVKSKVATHAQASHGPGPSAGKHVKQSVESRRGYAACRGYEPGQGERTLGAYDAQGCSSGQKAYVISQTPHQRSAPGWWQSCDGAGMERGQLQDCMGGGVQQGKPASY